MAPLSLKIVLEDGSVTRTMKFHSTMLVSDATAMVEEKIQNGKVGKDYGLFLKSPEGDRRGVWLEPDRRLDDYMLRDGDVVDYQYRMRNLKLKMLDGALKTMQVDESLPVEQIMLSICQKIGITNHDEYGLCCEHPEEVEDAAPSGAATLKRKTATLTRDKERDTKLEQLSKKLKTDDNVLWLYPHDTLREQCPLSMEPLLLKRRLFYTDNKVDSRDPVQLNLLYVQVRDAILDGKHPVTQQTAVEFAGIQCQVQFGDWDAEKHKPGFIEDLREFLPEQYSSCWGIEKDVLKSYRQNSELNERDAKSKYIKNARSMPTYGVTFFLVKEQLKGKKKLVPRLLGINSESILRLDQETKAILQVWPLTTVRSWNARRETFLLDFGDYSEKQYCVKTNDAFRIRDVLQGYIDIIKRKLAAPWNGTLQEGGAICEDHVQFSSANVITHVASGQHRKAVEQTYIGPNSIISKEHGQEVLQGSQTVITQKVIVIDKATNKEHVIMKESGVLSANLEKKIHDFNSNAVEILSLVDEKPYNWNEDVNHIVYRMKKDLAEVSTGVAEIAKQDDDKEKIKQLLMSLSQLRDLVVALERCDKSGDDTSEIEELCKETADASAKLYFTLNPNKNKKTMTEEFVLDPVAFQIKLVRFHDNCKRIVTTQASPYVNGAEMKELVSEIKEDLPFVIAGIQKLSEDEECGYLREQMLQQITHLNALSKLLEHDGHDRTYYQDISDHCIPAAEFTGKLHFVLKNNNMKQSHHNSQLTSKENLLKPLHLINASCSSLMIAIKKDRSKDNDEEVKMILKEMQDDLPGFITDMEMALSKEDSESKRDQLLEQLNILKHLLTTIQPYGDGKYDANELADRCRQISRCTDKMHYILEPQVKKRVPPSVPVRSDRGRQNDLVKTLNSLNSNSLNIVYLIAENPHGDNCEEIKEKTTSMKDDLSHFIPDAENEVQKQTDSAKQERLLKQLDGLQNAIAILENTCATNSYDSSVIEEQCMKVADLSTALGFEFDPACKRRSAMLRRSRQSFIEDDKALSSIQQGQLINSTTSTRDAVKQIRRKISQFDNRPSLMSEEVIPDLEILTADNISDFNAALAQFLLANTNVNNIDYASAKTSMDTLRELLPALVTNGLTLATSDSKKYDSDDMKKEWYSICDGLDLLCSSNGDQEKMHEATAKMSASSGKLMYVVGRKTNAAKEDEIIDLAKEVGAKTSVLLGSVRQLSESRHDDVTDAAGVTCAHAARALLATAQLTAPSISSTRCQNSLTAAIENMASCNKSLAKEWSKLTVDQTTTDSLMTSTMDVATALENLKFAYTRLDDVHADDDICIREIKTERTSLIEDTVQQKTDRVSQKEDIQVIIKPLSPIDEAIAFIENEQKCLKEFKHENIALDTSENIDHKNRLESNIAKASVIVNSILGHKHSKTTPDKQLFSSLCDLMADIVNDTKVISYMLDEKTSQELYQALDSLLQDTKLFISGVEDEAADLNMPSVNYGTSSAKLLYMVTDETDVETEKKLLEHVRSVCALTSSLACLSYERAGDVTDCCAAGRDACATAANLMYTAKLLSPTIHDQVCLQVLNSSFEDLNSSIQRWRATWSCFYSDSGHIYHVQEFEAKADEIQELIHSFDLQKERSEDLGAAEEMPLKKMAVKLYDIAKKWSHSYIEPQMREETASYVNRLGHAITDLDRAYAMCRRAPQDKNARVELEKAVFHLQQTLLKTRPNGQDTDCIVDLTAYISDLSQKADAVKETLMEIKAPKENAALMKIKEELEVIFDKKQEYDNNMQSFIEHCDTNRYEIDENGITIIDDYAKSNEEQINKINEAIQKLSNPEAKQKLENKMLNLTESCYLLRFASQAAQATERGATLDATLNELAELKENIPQLMKPVENMRRPSLKRTIASPGSLRVAQAALALRGAGCGGGDAGDALLAHVAAVRAATDINDVMETDSRTKELQDLVDCFESLSLDVSRRIATWRPPIDEANEHLLYELIALSDSTVLDDDEKNSQAKCMSKLLMPITTKPDPVQDVKKLQSSIQQKASKLNCTAELLRSNLGKPTLARSVTTMVDVARELAEISGRFKTEGPINREKVNKAAEDMLFVTFNLCKVAKDFGKVPGNETDCERKFHLVTNELSEAVNKLVTTVAPSTELDQTCMQLMRLLQSQQKTMNPATVSSDGASFRQCLDELQERVDDINKIKEDSVTWKKLPDHLQRVSHTVRDSVDLATQAAYLVSISKTNPELAMNGFKDVTAARQWMTSIKDNCLKLIREDLSQCSERKRKVSDEINELTAVITNDSQLNYLRIDKFVSSCQISDSDKEKTVDLIYKEAVLMNGALTELMNEKHDKTKINSYCLELVDMMMSLESIFDGILTPRLVLSADVTRMTDDIMNNSDSLISQTLFWLKEAQSCQRDNLTWVVFGTNWNRLRGGFDSLAESVRKNGEQAGIMKKEEPVVVELKTVEADEKIVLDVLLEQASKWLKVNPNPNFAGEGREAVRNMINVANEVCEDLSDEEEEVLRHLIMETEQLLLNERNVASDINSPLNTVKELKKAIERGVVLQVVEKFIAEQPHDEIHDIINDEKDDSKRKWLLQQKISELLAHLSRVTKTARIVASTRRNDPAILNSTNQAELTAPKLVASANNYAMAPNKESSRTEFEETHRSYSAALEMLQRSCDDSLDPLEFSQTTGDVVHKLLERSSTTESNINPGRMAFTINRLASRMVNVGLKSDVVKSDPELFKSLKETKLKLSDHHNADCNHKDRADQMLRLINEMESVFGGETIFKKKPAPDQPIFVAALSLHESVREWSSRDNDVVRRARAVAVLLARLQHHVDTGNKVELLATSKSIVVESQEVARLARRLAHECSDMRIKNDLLQVCDWLPTISGQLKMLTTVKGSTFGKQDTKEDREAMNTLVLNAQNLMTSVHDVVKNALSATVKIQSQHGGTRIKWVKKRY